MARHIAQYNSINNIVIVTYSYVIIIIATKALELR